MFFKYQKINAVAQTQALQRTAPPQLQLTIPVGFTALAATDMAVRNRVWLFVRHFFFASLSQKWTGI